MQIAPFRRRDPDREPPPRAAYDERRVSHSGIVLVVEDDPDVRSMMTTLLELDGYDVLAAENGEQALSAMRARRPCVVLLDIMMPVMDGWQFRRHQLAATDLAKVPVVCVTAVFDPARVEQELQTRCLRKPVDFDELLDEVAAACRTH